MLLRKSASSLFHHRDPPNRASATIAVHTAIAVRAFQRCLASGTAPGGKPLSRTAAPTIVTNPTNRNNPTTVSTPPSLGSSSSRRFATTTTGTTALPAPSGPLTLTVTPFDPPAITHRGPEYNPGSASTGLASSGGGAVASASKRLTWIVTSRPVAGLPSGLFSRAYTVATPGTTPGVATCITAWLGPALPSYQASGLPMCAELTS